MKTFPPMRLDPKGRCCGRRVAAYLDGEFRLCPTCQRAFHITENRQIANPAWRMLANGMFERTQEAR